MSRMPLSDDAQAQLAHLEALGDDDSHVDTSDIPEVTAERWAQRRRFTPAGDAGDTSISSRRAIQRRQRR